MPGKKLNRLTDADIAALKPKHGQRYPYADSDQRGLHIRVSPSGEKVHYATGRAPRVLNGPKRKQLWVKIGPYPDITIQEARERAKEIIRRIEAGQPTVEPEPTAAGPWQGEIRMAQLYRPLASLTLDCHVRELFDE